MCVCFQGSLREAVSGQEELKAQQEEHQQAADVLRRDVEALKQVRLLGNTCEGEGGLFVWAMNRRDNQQRDTIWAISTI